MAGFKDSPEEFWQRGDPALRPAYGSCVLSRTPGMVAMEEQLSGHALVATVLGSRPPVSPEDMVSALGTQCCIRRSEVLVEVCAPPADFFVRFKSTDDCERVFRTSQAFRCGHATIGFARWHQAYFGTPSELGYLCTLSFDGLPFDAWEPEALNRLVNTLGGEMVELLPASDMWSIEVKAWMKDPCTIPNVYHVEIPQPINGDSVPEKMRSYIHRITIHVVDVVDDEDGTKRLQQFTTRAGQIDDTNRPPRVRGGGHAFRGRAGGASF